MATVGERIDELTREYCGIFDSLTTDEVFSGKEFNIAMHDIVLNQHIWRKVEENLRSHAKQEVK